MYINFVSDEDAAGVQGAYGTRLLRVGDLPLDHLNEHNRPPHGRVGLLWPLVVVIRRAD
ncbi:MAG TPA: hypothetical protein VF880_00355 [Actinomycetes bacterium]